MLNIWDKLEQWVFWLVTSVATSAVAGVWWLVRTVFTNAELIRRLESDMEHRDKLRTEDRERMTRVEDGVETIKNILMGRDG